MHHGHPVYEEGWQKVLVTGGRHQQLSVLDRAQLRTVLANHPRVHYLLHGDATGIDHAVEHFITDNYPDMTIQGYRADWKRHGLMAGPQRNRRMVLALDDDDLAIIFPGGRGTDDCAARIKKRASVKSLHVYDWR